MNSRTKEGDSLMTGRVVNHLLIATVGALLVTGCATTARGTSALASSTNDITSSGEVGLAASTMTSQNSVAMLVGGTLALDNNGCIGLTNPDGTINDVLWPAGFYARTTGDTVEIVGAD